MSELGSGRLSFADAGEVDTFVSTLAQFEAGAITPDQWRAFRLVSGTYGQRQDSDASMLRVKIPQGILSAAQLRAIAEVTEKHSRGFSHITTRQNIQFHFVPLGDVADAMRLLEESGLTTREACGNAVRNITTSATAGVAADEVFDPVPYADAFTRHFLRHPLSASLPRKFKVAFSGGGRDHSFATINDIGFFAGRDVMTGERVFRVLVAGGTSTVVASGRLLFPALPVADLFAVGEALLSLFHEKGDRVHRHKNRMKFLVKALGWEVFRAEFLERFARALVEGHALPFDGQAPPEEAAPSSRPQPPTLAELHAIVGQDVVRGPGITPRFLPLADHDAHARFRRTNVAAQRQPGFSIVTVTVPLGDLSTGRWRALARLSESFANGELRTTPTQNLLFRWVATDQVDALCQQLDALGLAQPDPASLADVGSCPGAESCKLAVTQSRGLAQLINESFTARKTLLDSAEGLEVRVSGCPNGCGLHHVAGIGFQGGMRKVGGRAVPHYFLYVGGDAGGDAARFGRLAAKIPARRVPQAIERIIALYTAGKIAGESITTFLTRVDVPLVKRTLADLDFLDEASASAVDYVDLAESVAFTPEMTEGECAS